MTNYLDLTTEANVIPTLVAAATLGALESNMVLLAVVNTDYKDDLATKGQTVQVGVRGALSANSKGEGADVTVQAPATTKVDVTLNNHYEVTFGEEDIAIMMETPNQIAGYGDDAAIALLEQAEASIAALYSGFSQTIDATAGLSEANFREASRQLNAAKVPMRDRWAVLHEDGYAEAEDIEKLINRDYQGDAALAAVREGYLGKLNSFNVMLDQNIAVNGGQAKNLFMQRNAIAFANRPMRQTDLQTVAQVIKVERGIGIRVTRWYNANALAEQMTLDILYGVSELRDNHCVVVSTDEV